MYDIPWLNDTESEIDTNTSITKTFWSIKA